MQFTTMKLANTYMCLSCPWVSRSVTPLPTRRLRGAAEKPSYDVGNVGHSLRYLPLLHRRMLDIEQTDICGIPQSEGCHSSNVYLSPDQRGQPDDGRVGPLSPTIMSRQYYRREKHAYNKPPRGRCRCRRKNIRETDSAKEMHDGSCWI